MTNEKALRMAYSKRKDSAGEERDFLNTIIQALEQQPCEDCISREDILKSFKEIKFYTNHKGMRVVRLIDVIDCVLDAPSVQPQRKKGKWIENLKYDPDIDGRHWYCSECHHEVGHIEYKYDEYCSNCGAKMEVEE